MELYTNKSKLAIYLSLVILIVFGNLQSVFASTNYEYQRTGWSGGSGFVSPPKPGECPPSDPEMHCYEQKNLCNSDCECPKKQKCCFQQDCGYSCSDPTVIVDDIATCGEKIADTKPGICPKPADNIRCFQCFDQCKSDCECSGKQKCCPQPGCGNGCKDSIVPTTA